MIVRCSFGSVEVRRCGVRTAHMVDDLRRFHLALAGLTVDSDATELLPDLEPEPVLRVLRACVTDLPEDLSPGDFFRLAAAAWDVNGLDQLGKPLSQGMRALARQLGI